MTSTLPPLVQAFSGAIGSACANALIYPLDLATTRLQLAPPNDKRGGGIRGGFRILKHLILNHGIASLYEGLLPDTFATLLSNFFYFYFYTFLRSLSTKRLIPFHSKPSIKTGAKSKLHKPTLLEEVVLGFIAGVASRAISTPLNIITLKLQTESDAEEDDEKPTKPLTITSVVKLIYKEQGLAGFWKGFKSTTLLSLNPSITLAFFQLFRRALIYAHRRGGSHLPGPAVTESAPAGSSKARVAAVKKAQSVDLKPREAFIGGALSNSIAVALLYPIILAKTRVQASSANSMTEALTDAYEGKDTWSDKHVRHNSYSKSASEKQLSEPGAVGLYQGLEMKTLKGFLSQGVTFLVKGRIEQMIVHAYLKRMGAHGV